MHDIIWVVKCLCLDVPSIFTGHTHATQHCGDEVDIDSLATHEPAAIGEKDAYVTVGMHQVAVNDTTLASIPY